MDTKFTYNRMDNAYSVIDKIEDPINDEWFLTNDNIENVIKPNLAGDDLFYEYCLYILEKFIAITKEEKENKLKLQKLINSIEMEVSE